MDVFGFAQLGWLRKFVAVRSARNRMLSEKKKLLPNPTSMMFDPGPLMTPFADVPKKPGVGAANAVGSNQRLVVRSPEGRFGSWSWLGRIVTVVGVPLEVKAVPVGSGRVHVGGNNEPG